MQNHALLLSTVPDPCDPNPCANNGSCIPDFNFGVFECNCENEFRGILCQESKQLRVSLFQIVEP